MGRAVHGRGRGLAVGEAYLRGVEVEVEVHLHDGVAVRAHRHDEVEVVGRLHGEEVEVTARLRGGEEVAVVQNLVVDDVHPASCLVEAVCCGQAYLGVVAAGNGKILAAGGEDACSCLNRCDCDGNGCHGARGGGHREV